MEETSSAQERVRVLGVGNVLMGDDALGPYAVRVLETRYEIGEAVEVLDVGTPGLDFSPYLDGARCVIVLDTVTADAPPGTVRTYRRQELLAAPIAPRTSPHQPGLRESLMALDLAGIPAPEILLIGVVPASTETGTHLSPAVRAAVDEVLARTVAELERLGRAPRLRTDPPDPDIWWEREAPA